LAGLAMVFSVANKQEMGWRRSKRLEL
jgi:hypothetical protein